MVSFAPGCGVVDAQRLAGLVDAVEAVRRARRTGGSCARAAARSCAPGAGRPSGRVSCRPCRSVPRRSHGGRWQHRRSSRHAEPPARSRARTIPAKSRCGAEGMPWIGMTSLSTASLTMVPRMTLTKSMSRSPARRRRISNPTGVSMPFRQSLVDCHPDADDVVGARPCRGWRAAPAAGIAAGSRTSRRIRRCAGSWRATRTDRRGGRTPRSRCRPFRRPSFVQLRRRNDRRCGRCPTARPPSGGTDGPARAAATERQPGSQSSCPHPVRRPRWLIWIIAAAPCWWMPSVIAWIHGTMASS